MQPLGQPGAAGPDADEHRLGFEQRAHAAQQLGIQRFGVQLEHGHATSKAPSATAIQHAGRMAFAATRERAGARPATSRGLSAAAQVRLRGLGRHEGQPRLAAREPTWDARRLMAMRAGTGRGSPPPRPHPHCGTIGQRLGGGVALVDLMHRQVKAAVQLAREAPCALRVVVRRAVGMEGHADHQRLWLPFLHQRVDRGKARFALCSHRASAAAPGAAASCPRPRRRGACRSRRRETNRAQHRHVASASSCVPRLLRQHARVEAQQRQRARRSAARPACRR